MTRRNIDIPDELWRQVAIKAAQEGKSKRQVVVEGLCLKLVSGMPDKPIKCLRCGGEVEMEHNHYCKCGKNEAVLEDDVK